MSNIITQLRMIAADMLDVSEMEFSFTDVEKVQQSLRKFSTAIDELSNTLDGDRIANQKDLEDAERWRLVTDPEIKVIKRQDEVRIFRYYYDDQGNKSGGRLVSVGPTLLHAVNKALGYPT